MEEKDLEIKQEQPVEEKEEKKDEQEEVRLVEESLQKKVKELEEELNHFKDKYLRLYAEFENYKKRVQKDKEELLKYAIESIIIELLIVLDNLEMALEHSAGNVSIESLTQGVNLTLKELKKLLNKHGVNEIEALGKIFNPQYHHAMSHVEREDVEDKTVIQVFRKGYMLKDRVIRPSLVAVAKKIEKKEKEENNKESNKEQ